MSGFSRICCFPISNCSRGSCAFFRFWRAGAWRGLVSCRSSPAATPWASTGLCEFLRADYLPTPPPVFSQVFILKGVKVLCFDTLLQVFILKGVTRRSEEKAAGLRRLRPALQVDRGDAR